MQYWFACLFDFNKPFLRCENYYGLKWTYNNFPGNGRKKF